MADIKRINLEEIHKSPDDGMYITKNEKQNLAFLFVTFILTMLTVLKVRAFIRIFKR
jgi:hypothetical protein